MRRIVEFLKQNRKWNIALWAGIGLFLVIALLSINSRENKLRIRSVKVEIMSNGALNFLDSMKVMSIVKGNDSNRMILGTRREDLKLDKMERDLEFYPFIEKADVSVDISGRLIIKVFQRSPVMRIINKNRESYYVAKNGYKMPLHNGYSPRVLVANGNIAESLVDSNYVKSKLLGELLIIANHCNRDEFWKAQIEQMYVDNYLDIILIPKVGNHSIVFGSADRVQSKFEELRTFYFKGLNNLGWDKYKTINLKYEGQIVAEKKENYTEAIP